MSTERASPMGRAELVAALDRALQLVSSQSVLVSEAIAARLKMPPGDLEALGFLFDEGPAPAGRLGQATGLTSGAITRMIDRLERAGYVRRELDPHDRRRVIVRAVSERYAEAAQHYEPLLEAAHSLYERYSNEELALIIDFLHRSGEMAAKEIARLQPTAGGIPHEDDE